MSRIYHSTHTPGSSDRETLEALFVAREKLARGILDGIAESAATGNKHQRLLIGPRGIGKSHLVALIYYRVRDDAPLAERLRIAWLKEDHTIASYPGLLLQVLRALAAEHSLGDLDRGLEAILDLSRPAEQQGALERLLLEVLEKRTLLLIVENLDDLLADLRQEGQRSLRAFLQNHQNVTILATATSLAPAVAQREETFYGFFRITVIEPFRFDQGLDLLVRLADRDGNEELARALRNPLGHARARAVHYLTGGSPRIYVLFYDFLTRESLDELARAFLKLVDELTPYYQARMTQLAPLQREIIDALRRLRGAATVTDIARQTLSTANTVSPQLSKLRDLGYVVQEASLGRFNYYELREPLMRLVLDAKEQRGGTFELFVQFLRVWYSEGELEELSVAQATRRESAHVRKALEQARTEPDPLLSSLTTEFLRQQSAGNLEQALAEAELQVQRAPRRKEGWVLKARALAALGRDREAQLASWRRASELDATDLEALNRQSQILSDLGRDEEALEPARRAVEQSPSNLAQLRNLGVYLDRAGLQTEAREVREKVLALDGEHETPYEWLQRGTDLWLTDRTEEAVSAFGAALSQAPRLADGWLRLLGALQALGKSRLHLEAASRAALLLPDAARIQGQLGIALSDAGRFEDAVAAFDRALELDARLGEKGSEVILWRAVVTWYLGQDREALDQIARYEPADSPVARLRLDIVRAGLQMWLGEWAVAEEILDSCLESYPGHLLAQVNFRVGVPLLRNANPSTWRPFIALWLKVFGRHKRLPELGKQLVRSLRLLDWPWVEGQAARAWYRAWQELAGELEAMALPLRLLEAGVEYAARRDRRPLLALAREERGLLEPWLVNLFNEETDDLDRTVRVLLDRVQRRLEVEAQAEQGRRFWTAPPPDPTLLELDRLISGVGAQPAAVPSPLLPGLWETIGRQRLAALIDHLATHDPQAARAWTRPQLRVLAARRRQLSFSAWSLYQIDIAEDGHMGALDALASDEDAVVLDGQSATVYRLVENGTVELASEEARSEYTRFFSNTLRADDGRFQTIDSLADLHRGGFAELSPDLEVRAWAPVEASENEEGYSYEATVHYAGALFRARLRLSSPEQGFVEMLDDEPLTANLPADAERFDGPLRFLSPTPDESEMAP